METALQGTNIVAERILWHGTSADALESINLHGFNRSYCGKNGELSTISLCFDLFYVGKK
jgi:hypothetical protein